MYSFSLQIILTVSLGVIIYILAHVLPRIPDEVPGFRKEGFMDRIMKRLPTGRIDVVLNGAAEKILRQIRVWNLKIENLVNAGIIKVRGEQNGNTKNGGAESQPSEDIFDKK